MSEKRHLLTPGPTPVPPQVLAAISQPVVHHRSSDFRPVYERTLSRLREVFRTTSEVLLFGSAGTGAMESAAANLCSPGERVLVVSAGQFGERWRAIASSYRADMEVLEYAWGEVPTASDISARLQELGGAKAVFLTHSETSTGVVCDLQAIGAAAREQGALSVVDAVSSLGAVALEMLLDEGLDAVFDRHVRLGRACREGAKAMGLELFSPDDDRSAVVTAIRAPEGIDATELVGTLRDRFGITIANGHSALKGKIFRIGHIGYFDVFDITTALAAVELVLTDLGAEIERGAAVTRALEAYDERARV